MTSDAISVEDAGSALKITIRNRPHWITVIWAIACLAVAAPIVPLGWLVGSGGSNFGATIAVAIVAAVLGVAIFFVCAPILIWQFKGQEIITLDDEQLRIVRSVRDSTCEKVLPLPASADVRVMPTEHEIGGKWRHYRPATVSSFHIGRVGIESNKSVCRIGSGLTLTEAQELALLIGGFRDRA